ncbi:MAG: D-alanyl-D-alanine carboxypeptidase [Oscillospiraceae bacterium]|nr:D-alanyl-D-alanine carboxypeptidase [Oscillospiraceae bacterium]
MKANKWICLLLTILMLFSLVICAAATEPTEEEVPAEEVDPAAGLRIQNSEGFVVKEYADVSDIFKDEPHAAILIELTSDKVLYALDIHEKNYPASLTKIMTCYLALKHGKLDDVLTVSATALENLHESGSTADLMEGEEMTLENMLYCTMVASANEACHVIAEYISGSVEAFVELMNETARELGCINTHFANPHGLHDEDHYTTAYDLSLIAREALKDKNFRTITSVAEYTVPATNMSEERKLTSTNMLLVDSASNNYRYSKAAGIKTGFTTPAQCCLASTADDGNMQLLSIMMGAPIKEDENGNWVRRSFPETINLFEYAFENYEIATVMSTLYPIAEIEVTQSENTRTVALAPTHEVRTLIDAAYTSDDIVLDVQLNSASVEAPVEAGDVLGSVTVSYKGMILGKSDIAAITSVAQAAVSRRVDTRGVGSGAWWKWLLGILLTGVALILLYVIWMQVYRRRMRKQKIAARRRALEVKNRRQKFRNFFPDE